MTDTLLTTAQTDTDAVDSSESATDATEQTTDAQAAPAGEQGSQSTAETDGQEGQKPSDEQDQNADDDGKGEDQKDEEAGYHGAPESYEDFAIPEGVNADQEGLSAFQDLAKELDLSQEGAQKLIDFEAERQGRFLDQMLDNHRNQLEQWVNETKQDKDIGGANYEEATATARKAFNQFGDDAFKSLMEPFDPEKNPTGLGLGNHPALVRVFNRIGKAISEDQPGQGDPEGGSSEEARLRKRYPNTKA